MTQENKDLLMRLLQQYKELGISDQIDFDKFYLYSIITHSTAIEGSTVTEVEAQLLFDEGITSSKRTMLEQQMNLDLKVAYDYGREWIRQHEPITTDWLVLLASKVMARTGSEYHSIGGDFSAAKGELRKLNVTAGAGGKSYLAYQKVPARLAAFCEELNKRRNAINPADVAAVYDLSFWAHFELVTIHPWADGNGRTCRLLMNLLQWEFDVLPTKVLKEDKAEYIQALIDTRESENLSIFLDCMARHHCQHGDRHRAAAACQEGARRAGASRCERIHGDSRRRGRARRVRCAGARRLRALGKRAADSRRCSGRIIVSFFYKADL